MLSKKDHTSIIVNGLHPPTLDEGNDGFRGGRRRGSGLGHYDGKDRSHPGLALRVMLVAQACVWRLAICLPRPVAPEVPPACSRWLSAATPPGQVHQPRRTLKATAAPMSPKIPFVELDTVPAEQLEGFLVEAAVCRGHGMAPAPLARVSQKVEKVERVKKVKEAR